MGWNVFIWINNYNFYLSIIVTFHQLIYVYSWEDIVLYYIFRGRCVHWLSATKCQAFSGASFIFAFVNFQSFFHLRTIRSGEQTLEGNCLLNLLVTGELLSLSLVRFKLFLIKLYSSWAFLIFRAQDLQTRSDSFGLFYSKNPNSPHSSCSVGLPSKPFECPKRFSVEIYDILSKSPYLIFNAQLHNLQKSLVLLTFGFLPLLALLVGVCMCSLHA